MNKPNYKQIVLNALVGQLVTIALAGQQSVVEVGYGLLKTCDTNYLVDIIETNYVQRHEFNLVQVRSIEVRYGVSVVTLYTERRTP